MGWQDAPEVGAETKKSAWMDAPEVGAQKSETPKELGFADALRLGVKRGSAPFGLSADTVAGAIRGAGDIGSTLIEAFDKTIGATKKQGEPSLGALLRGERITDPVKPTGGLSELITGKKATDYDAERRAAMDAGLQQLGADPTSPDFKAGKLGVNVLGTLGAGPALALPLKAAKVAPALVAALETGGFKAAGATGIPGWFARFLGGGATGLTSAALVDPKDATTGAAFGAVLPGALKVLGITGSAIASMTVPQIRTLAGKLAEMTGRPVAEVVEHLQTGYPNMTGVQRTVPQVLQDPNISQVARTLKSSGQYALGEREAANAQQLLKALERVSPTAGTINEARANAGNAIADFAKKGERAASGNVNRLFDAIPKDEAKIILPLKAMQAASDKYLGKGSFGAGKGVINTALSEARQIGTESVPGVDMSTVNRVRERMGVPAITGGEAQRVERLVPFDELQNLRSSIGTAAHQAKLSGDKQAAAALNQMRVDIDNKIGAAVEAGDTFTPQAVDAYGQAIKAHAAKKAQFNTGPQAAIFRTGSDGLPAKEGAEVAPLFWNSGNAQIENMKAFKNLTKGDKDLVRLMKSNATTEALQQAGKGPERTLSFDAFDKWLRNHSGAAKELFTEQELQTLKAIKKETEVAAKAGALGRAEGSNTAQNLFSMGALGSPRLQALANYGPGKYITGPLLALAKSTGEKSRNEALSQLLADPDLLAKELLKFTRTPDRIQGALSNPNLRIIPTIAADQ